MARSKILLVDADTASRSYIAAFLQGEGYEVLVAGSGKEGLVAAWRDHPDLVLADPVMPDLAGEELATRLRSDARTARVPLVALSSDQNKARQRSCLRAGYREYLVKSPQVLPNLKATLARLTGGAAKPAAEGGLLIAFLSAKGGTGTSSLCANLAMNIAEDYPRERVVVADLVLPIGSIAGIVGYDGPEDLVTVAGRPSAELTPDSLASSLPSIDAWRFLLLAGSPDPDRTNALDVGRLGEVVAALKLACDFVVLDLGRSLSRISLPLIEHADLVAMIVGTDMSTVTLSKTVWDYLHAKGVQAPSVYLILNRAVGLEGVTKAEAEQIIGLPIQTAMPYLGGNVSLANNQHHPYTFKFPTDTASIILRDTARQMAGLAQKMRAA
jgi:pilus assembly protein CpaE